MQLAYYNLGADDPISALKGSGEDLRYIAGDTFQSSQRNVQDPVRHIHVAVRELSQYVDAT